MQRQGESDETNQKTADSKSVDQRATHYNHDEQKSLDPLWTLMLTSVCSEQNRNLRLQWTLARLNETAHWCTLACINSSVKIMLYSAGEESLSFYFGTKTLQEALIVQKRSKSNKEIWNDT